MNPVAPFKSILFGSILFDGPPDRTEPNDLSIFSDLNLDQVAFQVLDEFCARYAAHDPAALFLRAERRPDGQRTFRVLPGEPLPTSYGEDLYQQVFGTADTEALV